MRFYPGLWNGVSGFLDDDRNIEDKVKEELREELGIEANSIQSITLKNIFLQDAPEYKKTWIVHPVLVEVSKDAVTLDWEAQKYEWIKREDVKNFNLLPSFELVLERIFETEDVSWSMSRDAKKLSRIV